MGGSHPSRAAILAGQLEQLRSLVAELFPGNAFYAKKLNAAGVTFDVGSLEDFSSRFPFTTKAELVADQLAHSPFGTALTYPLERYSRFHQTSGTTGSPLRWLDTPESWEAMLECWGEVYSAAGVTRRDRVYRLLDGVRGGNPPGRSVFARRRHEQRRAGSRHSR
jgi:phenylacetate-CoA ligase